MEMDVISVKLEESLVEALDEMVRKGMFVSRSDAIRMAIWRKIDQEWQEESTRDLLSASLTSPVNPSNNKFEGQNSVRVPLDR